MIDLAEEDHSVGDLEDLVEEDFLAEDLSPAMTTMTTTTMSSMITTMMTTTIKMRLLRRLQIQCLS